MTWRCKLNKTKRKLLLAALDVRYIYSAIDADGWLCAYSEEPTIGTTVWAVYDFDSNLLYVNKGKEPKDWTKTRKRIKR